MATYISEVSARITGDSPERVAERFREFIGTLEQGLGRDCHVVAEVIERDYSVSPVDGWRGRIKVAPDIGPDLNTVELPEVAWSSREPRLDEGSAVDGDRT